MGGNLTLAAADRAFGPRYIGAFACAGNLVARQVLHGPARRLS